MMGQFKGVTSRFPRTRALNLSRVPVNNQPAGRNFSRARHGPALGKAALASARGSQFFLPPHRFSGHRAGCCSYGRWRMGAPRLGWWAVEAQTCSEHWRIRWRAGEADIGTHDGVPEFTRWGRPCSLGQITNGVLHGAWMGSPSKISRLESCIGGRPLQATGQCSEPGRAGPLPPTNSTRTESHVLFLIFLSNFLRNKPMPSEYCLELVRI